MLVISGLLLVFKDNIKDYAIEEINHYLNKRVHIGYIDVGIWTSFPKMSLTFENVLIHSRFDDIQTKDTALFAEKLRLRFDVAGVLSGDYTVKKIDIENGVLNMRIKEDGTINYDFIKQSEDTLGSSFEFLLEEINVENTRFSYINDATQQNYSSKINDMQLAGRFNEKEFLMHAGIDMEVKTVKTKALTLIQNKHTDCNITISMDQVNNIFEIVDADLKINQLPFQIKGKVTNDSLDFFIGASALNLVEVTQNFALEELNVIKNINGQGEVGIKVNILGPIATTLPPSIEADFSINNGSLKDPHFSANNIQASGHYSNGIATRREELTIENLSFTSAGSDFDAKISLTDFEKPRFKGFAKGGLNLKAIHKIFGPFGLDYLEGKIILNSRFDLRLNDPTHDLKNISIFNLSSDIVLENVKSKLINDKRNFAFPSGELVVRNQKAVFKNVKTIFDGGDIEIDGTFNHIVDYFNQSRSLYVDAAVESNYLDLSKLTNENATSISRNWILPNDIDGKINLMLDEVHYGGHKYSKIKTNLIFDRRKLRFPYLEAVNSGAEVSGWLSIEETNPMLIKVNTNLKSSNINFKPLFKNWNNFYQETITADNIEGIAKVDLRFSGPFDLFDNRDLKKEFEADINIEINNGALKNVQSFKEITKSMRGSATKLVINKERVNQFEKELLNLNFKKLTNTIKLSNGSIEIPKMRIESNALNLNLRGTHTFDNEIDYAFDFRFRDVLGDESSQFGEIVDDGTGVKIYLRMFGHLDDPNFEWDKEAHKKDRKERREEEKETLKEVLKTGFGINQGDSSIQEIKSDKSTKEIIEIDFSQDTTGKNDFNPDEVEKRKSNLQKKIDSLRKVKEKEEEEILEFD